MCRGGPLHRHDEHTYQQKLTKFIRVKGEAANIRCSVQLEEGLGISLNPTGLSEK